MGLLNSGYLKDQGLVTSKVQYGYLKVHSLVTSKFIEIGGLVHFFLSLVFSNSISALSWHSFIPPILLILKQSASC